MVPAKRHHDLVGIIRVHGNGRLVPATVGGRDRDHVAAWRGKRRLREIGRAYEQHGADESER